MIEYIMPKYYFINPKNSIYLLLNINISALKCYQGSGDSAVLSYCTERGQDRCTKQTNGSVVTYDCGLASDIIIEGSVADNACSTINSVEICLCSTDGCNTGNCYHFNEDESIISDKNK